MHTVWPVSGSTTQPPAAGSVGTGPTVGLATLPESTLKSPHSPPSNWNDGWSRYRYSPGMRKRPPAPFFSSRSKWLAGPIRSRAPFHSESGFSPRIVEALM